VTKKYKLVLISDDWLRSPTFCELGDFCASGFFRAFPYLEKWKAQQGDIYEVTLSHRQLKSKGVCIKLCSDKWTVKGFGFFPSANSFLSLFAGERKKVWAKAKLVQRGDGNW